MRYTIDLATDEFLTISDICRIFKMSRSKLDRMRAEGKFPQPTLQFSRKTPRWLKRAVVDWVAEQFEVARRRAAAPS